MVEESKPSKKGSDGEISKSRALIGSRVEPTSSTNIETPASSRPVKKK